MPELPEVEIVRQSLNKKIIEKKVKKVIVNNRNLRIKIPPNFESFLKNLRIIQVERFSKYIILHLSNNEYCLFHLGMSGTIHLVYNTKKKIVTNTSFYNSLVLPKNHNHIEIIFDDLKLVYNDPRRFGFFQIIKNSFLLKKDGHRYEAFIQQDYSMNNNTTNIGEEERMFETKIQKKRLSLNPKTLEKVEVPEKKTIIFRSSKEWKDKLNEKK